MRGSSSLVGAGGQGDGGKSRRGSIRHAVRKIFGRTSRDITAVAARQSSPQVSAPIAGPTTRHAYHRSEPAAAYPPQTFPEVPLPFHEDDIIPQTVLTSHIRAKTSSPYAVSFPKSVMLKPMDLGNPHSQMKRRKTMPNTGGPLRDAAAADAADVIPIPIPTPQLERISDVRDDRQARRALTQIKKNRRKSRSTDDLTAIGGAEVSSPIQKSSEMRQWRESFQPDVIRASGFTTTAFGGGNDATPRQVSTETNGHIPMVLATDSFESARDTFSSIGSPKQFKDAPTGKEESRPQSPVDFSHDLEERVLKLEAGLNSFQRSLARLTADRNRRTIVLRSDMTDHRSSGDMRTPSMLADTLVDSLEPSSYEYQYGRTLRPSASASLSPPPLLQSRPHYDDEPEEPLTPTSDHYADSVRLPTPPHSRSPGHAFSSVPASLPPSSASSPRRQQHTFHSVYQMLSDERSARQKLERHLHHLQQEISDLHAQVNTTSSTQQRPNDRNSYMLAGSSARLQQLLQETEEANGSKHYSSEQSPGGKAPVTSRFSGSESEAGAQIQEYDEGETPYGAYLTPREERSAQSLAGRLNTARKDDDDLDCMF